MKSVLFASHTAESSVFHVGSHHLAREIARDGHRVGHLATPLSPLKLLGLGDRTGLAARWRQYLRGPETIADRQWTAVPMTLLPVQKFALAGRNIGLRSSVPSLPRTVARMGLAPLDHLIIDQPLFAGLVDLVSARTVIYRPTDVYSAPSLLRAQAALLERVDGVVATSDRVLAALPRTARNLPHLVLTNGVEVAHFDQSDSGDQFEPRSSRAGAVYMGALDQRIDWSWIVEVARAAADVTFDLYGPVPSDPPPLPTNVVLRGPVDYLEAPRLLARYSVGLLPFAASEENLGRSPMKLYEYLAAGLRILGTGQYAAGHLPLPGVANSRDASAAAQELTLLLERSGDDNAEGRALARTQDWSVRARDLMRFLDDLRPGL